MPKRYQDVYPSPPLIDSAASLRPSAAELLTLEYFEAEPGQMPTEVFDQHHILLNLRDEPQRVENWRDGEHREFRFEKHDIVVTPAGVQSGWRWHERSKVIVVTLEPDKLRRFAQSEVAVLLTDAQLRNLPLFNDPEICHAGIMLRDAVTTKEVGSQLLFECLARVFLIKLIQKYGQRRDEEPTFGSGFTVEDYKRVLDFVSSQYGEQITLEQMAKKARLSPSHFSRVFKRAVGTSPMRFVTAFRVEQAKKRLSRQDQPLIAIAIACGFADQAHFSRVFKQAEGLSPKAYRAALAGS